MESNYHTHTTFCDGADSPEELVAEAIRLGCPEIGFSGHSYLEEDSGCMSKQGTQEYCREIRRLREKYRDQITIRLGIEQDIFSEVDRQDFDFIIGAVHYIEKNGKKYAVDESREGFLFSWRRSIPEMHMLLQRIIMHLFHRSTSGHTVILLLILT